MNRICVVIGLLLLSFGAKAESVTVKYRGVVDLAPFQCTDVNRISFVHRVCYDQRNEYMLIQLGGVYYHYCRIDGETVSGLLAAESVGQFYDARIKGRFDCRVIQPPQY